jgi:ABC-type nickel/cobalt efflux system permease component RcnA
MRAIRETGSWRAVVAVSLIAFLYGVVHAAGPGHGKLVASSYLLAHDASPRRGVAVGSLISLLQVVSSVGLVLVLAVALGYAGFDVLDHSVWVELASYGLIVGIGLVITLGALTGRGHHGHHGHPRHAGAPDQPGPGGEAGHRRAPGRREGAGVILAAGLTPCASAIILMLFALANGVPVVGLAASLVMAVGMALTVSAVGVVTVLARRAAIAPLRARPRAASWVSRALAVAGGSLITLVGALFLAGAWSRLPG